MSLSKFIDPTDSYREQIKARWLLHATTNGGTCCYDPTKVFTLSRDLVRNHAAVNMNVCSTHMMEICYAIDLINASDLLQTTKHDLRHMVGLMESHECYRNTNGHLPHSGFTEETHAMILLDLVRMIKNNEYDLPLIRTYGILIAERTYFEEPGQETDAGFVDEPNSYEPEEITIVRQGHTGPISYYVKRILKADPKNAEQLMVDLCNVPTFELSERVKRISRVIIGYNAETRRTFIRQLNKCCKYSFKRVYRKEAAMRCFEVLNEISLQFGIGVDHTLKVDDEVSDILNRLIDAVSMAGADYNIAIVKKVIAVIVFIVSTLYGVGSFALNLANLLLHFVDSIPYIKKTAAALNYLVASAPGGIVRQGEEHSENIVTCGFKFLMGALFGEADSKIEDFRSRKIMAFSRFLSSADCISKYASRALAAIWHMIDEYKTSTQDRIKELQELDVDIGVWVQKVTNLDAGPVTAKVRIDTDPIFAGEVIELCKAGEQMFITLNKMEVSKVAKVLFDDKLKRIRVLADLASRMISSINMRPRPFVVYNYGPTGIGKSYMSDYMMLDLMKSVGISYSPAKDKFAKPLSSSFYEGYWGQKLYVINDAFQARDTESRSKQMMELIGMCQNSPHPLDAAFTAKGSLYFTSPFIYLDSQLWLTKQEVRACIEEPEALYRRLGVIVKPVLKEKYTKNGKYHNPGGISFCRDAYCFEVHRSYDEDVTFCASWDFLIKVLREEYMKLDASNKSYLADWKEGFQPPSPPVQPNVVLQGATNHGSEEQGEEASQEQPTVETVEQVGAQNWWPEEDESTTVNKPSQGITQEEIDQALTCLGEDKLLLHQNVKFDDMRQLPSASMIEPSAWFNWLDYETFFAGINVSIMCTLLYWGTRLVSWQFSVFAFLAYGVFDAYTIGVAEMESWYPIYRNLCDDFKTRRIGMPTFVCRLVKMWWATRVQDTHDAKTIRRELQCTLTVILHRLISIISSPIFKFLTIVGLIVTATWWAYKKSNGTEPDKFTCLKCQIVTTKLTEEMCDLCHGTDQEVRHCVQPDVQSESYRGRLPPTSQRRYVEGAMVPAGRSMERVMAVAEGSIDLKAVDMVRSKILPNCFHITRTGAGIISVKGVFVAGNAFLIPHHFIKAMVKTDTISIYHKGTSNVPIKLEAQDINFTYENEARDFAIIFPRLSVITPRPSLHKNFMSRAGNGWVTHLDGILCSYGKMGKSYAYEHNTVKDLKPLATITINGDIQIQNVVEYDGNTTAGDCGSVLTVMDKSQADKIVGIHIAGAVNQCMGYSTLIYREDIEEAIALAEPVHPTLHRQGLELAPPTVASLTQPIGIDDDLNVLGNLADGEFAMSNGKTSIKHGLLHGIYPPTTKPAMLRPQNGIDPMRKGVIAAAHPRIELKTGILDDAVEAATVHLNSFDTKYRRSPKILTMHEAVFGIENDPWIRPLDATTSSGYPFNLLGNKKFYIDFEKQTIAPEIVELVEKQLQQIKQGEIPVFFFSDTLKDERRPIAKVDAGKTRVFSASNLAFTIICRMYFMSWFAHLYSIHDKSCIGPGLNALGQSWTLLYNRLSSAGEEVIAGDFQLWDKVVPYSIVSQIHKLTDVFYTEGAKEREIILQAGAAPYRICKNVVYQAFAGLPSGWPGTSLLNTVVNLILSLYAFRAISTDVGCPLPCSVFFDYCEATFYGDDQVIAVSPRVSRWFNMLSFAKLMKEINFGYTNPDKGPVTSRLYLKDVSYLKRTFLVESVSSVKAPLEIGVIRDMIQWRHKSMEPVEALQAVYNSFVCEMFQHGKDAYETEVAYVQREAGKKGVVLNYFPYEYLQADRDFVAGCGEISTSSKLDQLLELSADYD